MKIDLARALALGLLLGACAAPEQDLAPGLPPDLAAPASWRVAACPHCPPGLDEALTEEAAGHWNRAEELYAEASDRDPLCDRALLGHGRVLLALGRAEEAAEALAAGCAARPTSTKLVGARACALYAAGHHAEVVEVLSRLDVDTLPPDALVALGRSALLSGNYMVAGAALSRQVALQPADGGAWLDLARTLYLMREQEPGLYALRKARDLGADLGALQPLVDAAGS
jgi:Flp pilus assembly protein TadD